METVNVVEAKEMIENELGKKLVLIDVRSPMEYKSGHIKGSRLLPLDEIDQWADSLDKEMTYIINCRSGGRSGMACQILESKGFKTINIMGGIMDWVEEGFPIEN